MARGEIIDISVYRQGQIIIPVNSDGEEIVMIVGVVKSLTPDGGKVITHCISIQCKWSFGFFTNSL